MYLFGAKKGESMEIPIGIHYYDFVYQLPLTVPSSVEGKNGNIRYKIDANLDIPWAFDMHAFRPFTVLREQNVTNFPELLYPVEVEEIKTFHCCCYSARPLKIKIRIPKSCFELGERIPISVEMINKSSTDVRHTTISLQRIENMTSQRANINVTKTDKINVAKVRCRGVRRGDSTSFDEFFVIPMQLAILNDQFCNIFQVAYELQVIVKTGGISRSPRFTIPITICSVGTKDEQR